MDKNQPNSLTRSGWIALLTDFGVQDPFVGIMKGVIAGIAPQARVVDLTHLVPPGDIQRGALYLWQARPYFPSGTVYLAVVDPGVGTSRRALALQAGPDWYVGPDNGLFTFVVDQGWQAWELTHPAYRLDAPGATFHGRDIFAPGAAYLARGIGPQELGPPIEDMVTLPHPLLANPQPGVLTGEVLYPDRFGNLVTSLGRFRAHEGRWQLDPWLPQPVAPVTLSTTSTTLQLSGGRRLPLLDTFASIPPGSCAALIGSTGLLEIAANRGSAAELLELTPGATVTLVQDA